MILFQIQFEEQSILMFNIEAHVRLVYHSDSNKYYIRLISSYQYIDQLL